MAQARGKYAKAISDRSGMEFPYNEMVKEWNGSFVHRSEFERKHPQLELRTRGGDAEGLLDARNDRTATDQADQALTKIDRSTYSALSNKLSKGTPSQYFVQRFVDKTTVTIYPCPDSTAASKDMHIFFVKRIQDADSTYTDATDVPFRFVPCMVSGLAFYLAQKFAPERVQAMKLYYEDEFQRALSEDGSSTSVHITPKTYYPGT